MELTILYTGIALMIICVMCIIVFGFACTYQMDMRDKRDRETWKK